LIYGSVCSGIEAASCAWEPLGWKAAFLSDIEKFPRAVLKHHYPEIPLHGDFTTIGEKDYGPIDLLVGGTPCQSFSIAGLRNGMEDDRGNLAIEYLKLADRKRPKWMAWENVPGVLSSNKGRDFGAFLGGLVELGYGFSYRILDAQFFGVPQRRRRVFVVGYLGDWRPAAAVLFERESLQRNPKPSRKERENITSFTTGSFGGYKPGVGTLRARTGDVGGGSETLITGTLLNNGKAAGSTTQQCPENGMFVVHGTQDPDVNIDLAHPLGRNNGAENAVAFTQNSRDEVRLIGGDGDIAGSLSANEGMKQRTYVAAFKAGQGSKAGGIGFSIEQAPTLTSSDSGTQAAPALLKNNKVRRLTPIECERLQGFPDNWTKIPWRNKTVADCPDGPRYRAIGNSMAVPVMSWIGKRIDMVDKLL